MVLLPGTEELASRYAPYIQELQEFFAVHDLRCGSPRELGFLAARLSGRDSFPGELASMARSFIFREGGSFPLPHLLTVVALAIGGPAVADYTAGLQHPLNDLSSFLASVARAPIDQPPPAPVTLQPEAAQTSAKATRAYPFAEPSDTPTPFYPPLSPDAALAPAIVAASTPRPHQPATIRRVVGDPAGRRGIWVVLATGLPLLLLAILLFRQFNPSADVPLTASANPSPEPNVPASSSAPPGSISAPHAIRQTSLATAAAALAQPNSSGSVRPTPALSHAGRTPGASLTVSAQPPAVSVPASNPVSLARPPASLAATSDSRAETSSPTTSRPTVPSAASTPKEAASPPPHAAPAPSAAGPASVASVTAHQGAVGISSGIMSSHLVFSSQPKYPKMAGLTNAEGQVILQAVVSKTGRVSAVKALSGPHTLRKAAEKAVRQWRYRPYIAEGRPTDIATIITIEIKAPH